MREYVETIGRAYRDYAGYLWQEITLPRWDNYFYWLLAISLFFFAIEWVRPWRPNQPKFRKDFWLDVFYMYFNFFLFFLVIFNAVVAVADKALTDLLGSMGLKNQVAIFVNSLPSVLQLLILFVVRDFAHWNIHRLLHRVPWLWEFHKVHHSVKQMGFAAHLRFHWMETVVYRTLEFLPLALIGFGIDHVIIVYLFTLAVGHFNHTNIRVPLGPFKYIFNNPQMHIWHDAKELPPGHRYGVNFGLTLSIWDYLFGTASIPKDGRDIELGFPNDETFPKTFWGQILYGLGLRRRR